ncbi:phosphate ABC transporter substrate-binding protein PstS [Cupriavidus sp. WKF15]|uniref:phosphate ABC transporter substrate-binding protein PstS n=1 Tax=Cupriavidus sp. WKF15 TaxID=3032282 RepID=UPI0023E11334|nr:phosphate ABC transporter substrate-binding protein PstS [Cupriavidus sp. WKF15]WER50989.1 phosphate ABC transporter substrate-binding protein PstS [Cupriavidus sp. WKF15]
MPYKAALALAALMPFISPLASAQVRGAGSTAAAPVYQIWAESYKASTGVNIAYEAVGSSEGMKRVRDGGIDFGASDVPLSASEAKRVHLVLVPTVVTAAVPVVNLPSVAQGQLRLTGDVLAKIFLGKLDAWDATEIQALNPGISLPKLKIRPVVRADGSGTTFHFTDYLSNVSDDWKIAFGTKSSLSWPVGFLTAKGSDEVVRAVRSTPGTIAYIDYNYVLDAGLSPVQLRNAAGNFVTAQVSSFREAVLNSDWNRKGDFSSSLVNRPGRDTWPITMGTFVAVPEISKSAKQTLAALRFVTWGYLRGDDLARRAKFVPLPERVQANAYRELARITDESGAMIGLQSMASTPGPKP